jgi:hypothetical protein
MLGGYGNDLIPHIMISRAAGRNGIRIFFAHGLQFNPSLND